MKVVIVVLALFVASAKSQTSLLFGEEGENPPDEIFYYGFPGYFAGHDHWMPSEAPAVKVMEEHLLPIHCPAGQTITVKRASFGTPIGEGSAFKQGACHHPQSTYTVKRLCAGREKCKVLASVSTFGKGHDPCPDTQKALAVDYECTQITEPRPLYDRATGTFREGVHPIYLYLPTHTAPCKNVLSTSNTTFTIGEATAECDSDPKCAFFTFDPNTARAVYCSDDSWTGSEKHMDAVVCVKPREMSESSFAIYPNNAGICSAANTIKHMDDVKRPHEAAEACRSQPNCTHFTWSDGGLLSAEGFRAYAWLCSGTPSQIPHDGFAFGVYVGGPQPTLPPRKSEDRRVGIAAPGRQGYPTQTQLSKARLARRTTNDRELAGQIS
ncbi:unnamed protein product [Vitrella brassicaformis CCMP3155]|uniref:SUEL-type lectin domain-containing protein n=1 Tax=Vitrella brassicaformis (strain CCMP3155) TaxID=1169540 RepID=A0A0G4GZR9_VITBC|nr:unnamed protein product [Vitrella brassicaformis CCMP3155]|eukprot:CEM36734.1 unnamed protein product [Vitrella brassicaformis CCMP3155]